MFALSVHLPQNPQQRPLDGERDARAFEQEIQREEKSREGEQPVQQAAQHMRRRLMAMREDGQDGKITIG